MASDAKKRQKKLERRAAHRKDKKHQLVRQKSAGLADKLTAATKYPVLHCWIGNSLEAEGIGPVGLSRQLPNGMVAFASFLVDRYCLGVKDAFGHVLPRSEYDEKIVREMAAKSPSHPVPPADARKLVEDAVAYAHSIGLVPHPDYAKVKALFGPIDPATSRAVFEFGKDGKPYFIAGPHDTPQRCRHVMSILTNTCGPGNFHYMLPLAEDELGDLPLDELFAEGVEDLDVAEELDDGEVLELGPGEFGAWNEGEKPKG